LAQGRCACSAVLCPAAKRRVPLRRAKADDVDAEGEQALRQLG